MNDVRNLMGHLHSKMDYKEFDGATRPPAEAWPILQRVGRMTPPAPAPAEPPALETETAPAERAPRTALVRGLKRPKRSLLNRYAAAETVEPEAEDPRRLPLAEVFARLAASR